MRASMRCQIDPFIAMRPVDSPVSCEPARGVTANVPDLCLAVPAHDCADQQYQALEAHIARCFDHVAQIHDDEARKNTFWSVARAILSRSGQLISDDSRQALYAEGVAGGRVEFWNGTWPWADKIRSEVGPRLPARIAMLNPLARARHELRLFNLALATVNHVLWDRASCSFSYPCRRYASELDGTYPFRWPDGSAAHVEVVGQSTLDRAFAASVMRYIDPALSDTDRAYLYRENFYGRRMEQSDLIRPEEHALIGQWGAFAQRRIAEGVCLGVYGGTLLDYESTIMLAERRHLANVSTSSGPGYYVNGENVTSLMNTLFTFDTHARIVAQSPGPYNVRAQAFDAVTASGIPLSLIAFFSACEIERDSELRWNYGLDETALVKNGLR
jgi:hypothetical protein